MQKKSNFNDCPHFDKQPCPGLTTGAEGGSSGTFVYTSNGNNIKSTNFLDFARDHEYKCSECPINKGK